MLMFVFPLITSPYACGITALSGGGAPAICVCWPAFAAISGGWRYKTISDCLKYLRASRCGLISDLRWEFLRQGDLYLRR